MRLEYVGLILCSLQVLSHGFSLTFGLRKEFSDILPDSLGCFKDRENVRDLSVLAKQGEVDIFKCMYLCRGLGYRFFGMQDGTECWCGNFYGRHGRAASDSECRIKCSGNRRQRCGGRMRNKIYPTKPSAKKPRRPIKFLFIGCYRDSTERDLPLLVSSGAVTVASCGTACKGRGFGYFGLQNGRECWCGKSFGNYGAARAAAKCTQPCAGNSKQKCGGAFYNSVYATSARSYRKSVIRLMEMRESASYKKFRASANTELMNDFSQSKALRHEYTKERVLMNIQKHKKLKALKQAKARRALKALKRKFLGKKTKRVKAQQVVKKVASKVKQVGKVVGVKHSRKVKKVVKQAKKVKKVVKQARKVKKVVKKVKQAKNVKKTKKVVNQTRKVKNAKIVVKKFKQSSRVKKAKHVVKTVKKIVKKDRRAWKAKKVVTQVIKQAKKVIKVKKAVKKVTHTRKLKKVMKVRSFMKLEKPKKVIQAKKVVQPVKNFKQAKKVVKKVFHARKLKKAKIVKSRIVYKKKIVHIKPHVYKKTKKHHEKRIVHQKVKKLHHMPQVLKQVTKQKQVQIAHQQGNKESMIQSVHRESAAALVHSTVTSGSTTSVIDGGVHTTVHNVTTVETKSISTEAIGLGCFKDTRSPRDLPLLAATGSMSVDRCLQVCHLKRHRYFGLQDGNECWCGDQFGKHSAAADDSSCATSCSGTKSELCGGTQFNSVYEIRVTSGH